MQVSVSGNSTPKKKEVTSEEMKSVFLYITCFTLGFLVFLFWLSGSHGHLTFRYWMLEDWILLSLLILLWGIPVFILLILLFKKLLQSNRPTRI